MSLSQALKIALLVIGITPQLVFAEAASEERATAARGHYARARAMLVEALTEFEAARKIATPDLLLDPEEWRLSIVTRTEELNRVLDPKPRVTRSGVRFNSGGLRVTRAADRLPGVANGARETNTYGEEQIRGVVELERSRSQKIPPPGLEPIEPSKPQEATSQSKQEEAAKLKEELTDLRELGDTLKEEVLKDSGELPRAEKEVRQESPDSSTRLSVDSELSKQKESENSGLEEEIQRAVEASRKAQPQPTELDERALDEELGGGVQGR